MSWLKLFTRSLLVFALSAGVTLALYRLDLSRGQSLKSEEALALARQISSEAEGLSFYAREHGEKDPIGFALGFLNQSPDQKAFHLSKLSGETTAQNPTASQADFENHFFEYTKIFTIEDGSGIKIKVPLESPGFLGSRTKLGNDLALAGAFGFFALIFGFAPFAWRNRRGSTRLRDSLKNWSKDSKELLVYLGKNIREMIRQAQAIAASAARSRENVSQLRAKIHAGVHDVHLARQWTQDSEKGIENIEKNLKALILQARALGAAGIPMLDYLVSIQHEAKQVKKLTQQTDAQVKKLQVSIEPWSTDADLAFHAYKDIFDATHAMSDRIKLTTKTLLEQAKMIQHLNLELSDAAEMRSVIEPEPFAHEPELKISPPPPLKKMRKSA